jgi:two-component system nitrogen regulation response regulator NtrX
MPNHRPCSVLVVDDETDVRDLLVDYFREAGHEVSSAADGTQAVAEITTHPTKYDLIISDLQLPGIDGLGVLKAAKAANPDISVIIVTGYASVDSAVRAVRMGAYDYLTKPFTLGQIEVIVRRAAERQALEAANRQLAERTGGGHQPANGPGIADQLQQIDARLARIEQTLSDLGHLPPVPGQTTAPETAS